MAATKIGYHERCYSGNRGGNERMTCHAGADRALIVTTKIDYQPPLAQYLGRYARPPIGEFLVTAAEDGSNQLVLR